MYFKISRFIGMVLLVAPSIVFAQNIPTTTASTSVSTSASTTATTTQNTPDNTNPAVVKARVQSYFADIPVMIAIAGCESSFTQFNTNGSVLGEDSGSMIGIYQINKSTHFNLATSLGYNIDTVDGNIGFARYLYSKSSTDPWISSFPCWSKSTTNPENATTTQSVSTMQSVPITVPSASVFPNSSVPTSTLTANLSFGMNNPQVIPLQQLLNAIGYTIATTGPGSLGNETTLFGNFTRASVRKFQCAKGIVCSGDEASTGYGYVGSRTRTALLTAMSASGGTISQTSSAPSAQPSSSSSSASSASASASTNNAAAISALQAQVANYQQLITGLNAKITALQTGQ